MMQGQLSESQIERKLCAGVKRLGGLCLKWVSPGCTGVPDRIVLMPGGRLWFVELKTDAGAPSPRQTLMLHRLSELGFHATLVYGQRGVDWMLRVLEGGEDA